MPHQEKSQKCYLDQEINLEWPDGATKGDDNLSDQSEFLGICKTRVFRIFLFDTSKDVCIRDTLGSKDERELSFENEISTVSMAMASICTPMNLKPLVHVLLRPKMYLNYLEQNQHASNTQY